MICPRSYSKGGRARFQTEVQFQGPLLPPGHHDAFLPRRCPGSGSGGWVDGSASTRQTAAAEEEASRRKTTSSVWMC